LESWLAFWNAPNRIYVSERHRRAHFDKVFASVRPYLRGGAVLDWGCGDALAAERMAPLCRRLLLHDGAAAVRERLRRRVGDDPRVAVLDEAGVAALADGSIDLIIVNSVIQYLGRDAFRAALRLFQRLLGQDGTLILGDVIEPGTPMWRDAGNLLRVGAREGYLLAALAGLASTFVSPYRRLRRRLGFSMYRPDEIAALMAAAGLAAEPLAENVALSRTRRSYLARKRA
jgi:SAM-dependent methyltransferase